MFRLIGKDLRILGRSRLLVVTLVLYPLLVALLIGLALSRAPEKPKIAVVDQIPRDVPVTTLAGKVVDPAAVADQLVKNLDAVRVPTRAEAAKLVEDGDVLAAIILPDDINDRLSATINLFGGTPPEIEVLVNGSDPVKARYVESVVDARLADANLALSTTLTKVVASYVTKLVKGGKFTFGPITVDILGLQKSKQRIDTALRALPPDSRVRARLAGVSEFAGLAVDNLDGSAQGIVSAVSQPLVVKTTRVDGRDTPLETFAVATAAIVSLMLVALMLGAALLALERTENTYARLVRGLVRPEELIGSKLVLAGGLGALVAFALLGIVSIFVELDWGSADRWILALVLGGLAFAALGVALAVLARDVETATLLAFALALPLAFLALVPQNAVSAGLYDVITVVSAAFPFKPALDALQDGLDGVASTGPALHLAALAIVYAVAARLGLRRLRA
ncbi:MAG TPA: ABC transporter permease [Solirubrobacteraceae bacterium]|nr:ABC transporter permease [Solirubrobacteraceae bacterium]